VNRKTIFLLVVVNGFVGLIWYRGWESGTPLSRVIPLGLVSLAAVTAATIAGAMLGEKRARQKAGRTAARK
jgi:hypothetical protein